MKSMPGRKFGMKNYVESVIIQKKVILFARTGIYLLTMKKTRYLFCLQENVQFSRAVVKEE